MLIQGYYLIVSLDFRHSCASAAKVLQASQGIYYEKPAHMQSKKVVLAATIWKILSMVDTVGPVEIVSRR